MRNIKIIFLKELMDTFRDRNTVISMILLPIIMYPLLMIAIGSLSRGLMKKMEKKVSKVAIINRHLAPALVKKIDDDSLLNVINADKITPGRFLKKGENISDTTSLSMLRNREVQLVLEIPADYIESASAESTYTLKIYYDRADEQSNIARRNLESVIDNYENELVENKLKNRGIATQIANPIKSKYENVASDKKMGGFILGRILPYMLIVFSLMSAFYPAIDLTAGEKERGTLETILVSLATKREIVIGKYLTVITTTIVATGCNLLSIGLTFSRMSFITEELGIKSALSLPPLTALFIILFMIPLSAFVSSLMMSIAVLTRSFKEGQNYLNPLLMILILPATVSLLPGTELNYVLSSIPILNVSLLFKDMMVGTYHWGYTAVALLSTTYYAILSLILAINLFEREDVLFKESEGITIPGFISKEEKERNKVSYPTPLSAVILASISIILIFYIGSKVQMKSVQIGLIITEILLVLAPAVIYLKLWGYDFKRVLRLNAPPLIPSLLVIPIGISALIIVLEIGALQNIFFPFPEELIRGISEAMKVRGNFIDIIKILFVIALLPGICEETLFRGTILPAFEKSGGMWRGIILTGILFGLFHFSPYRWLPTGLLGILFGYLVIRSNSIFVGMFAHFLNNGIAVIVVNFLDPKSPQLKWLISSETGNYVPLNILIPAIVVFIVSIYGFNRFAQSKNVDLQPLGNM